MLIKWSDELSVGVELIDEQHQEMFRRINRLLGALSEVRGTAELCRTVDFLTDYVHSHFETEEAYMTGNAYPGRQEHMQQHEYFRGEVAQLRARAEQEGPTEKLVVFAQELLVDWFTRHIRGTDMAFGRFLKEKGIA